MFELQYIFKNNFYNQTNKQAITTYLQGNKYYKLWLHYREFRLCMYICKAKMGKICNMVAEKDVRVLPNFLVFYMI